MHPKHSEDRVQYLFPVSKFGRSGGKKLHVVSDNLVSCFAVRPCLRTTRGTMFTISDKRIAEMDLDHVVPQRSVPERTPRL